MSLTPHSAPDDLDPAAVERLAADILPAIRDARWVRAFGRDAVIPTDAVLAEAAARAALAAAAPTVDPLTPPPGWFVFGTHANDGSDAPLEFYGDDGGGMPVWERPAAPTVEQVAEVLATHDADRITYDAYSVDGCDGCDWQPTSRDGDGHQEHQRHQAELVAALWGGGERG